VNFLFFKEKRTKKMAKHIKTDGTEHEYLPKDDKFTLEELQSAVGGMIEVAPNSPQGKVLLVNEEGLLLGLPLNPFASRLIHYPIVGDALLLDESEWD
jgi:hypothetical protein